MQTNVHLDDDLVAEARRLTGMKKDAALMREALGALIERESGRRLAQLGAAEPELSAPLRRRPASA